MALAETAQLLVKLTLQDEVTPTAQKAKSSLGDFGKTVIGLAGAAGFGLLTKGALDAQAAQGKFMAATGASRQEAEKFVNEMDGLAGSAGAAGKSLNDIYEVGTTVEQQFGTTGKATQDLTSQILDFAKASGQDANQAAGDLEDTLSAYGLTADDAKGFTDELVASTQKYGTEVGPQQLDLIRKISPALQTMGGDINDAVGYLNLMETAGLDAADGQKAFNTALANMPEGTTIDDLVKHFADLKSQGIDPTAEAIKTFGTRAGPAFLKAIQPGMDGLDDFTVSAEDAKDASHNASEAMQTDAEKIAGVFQKLQAGAADLGQQLGPAITGLASLTSLVAPLAGGLKDVVAKAAAQVLPEATIAGGAVGTAFAAGVATLGAAALAAAILQAFNDAKHEAETDPNGINNTDLFNARAPMWARAKIQAAQGMQTLGAEALDAFNKAWDAGIASGLSPSDPALLAAATAAGNAVGKTAGTAAGDASHDSFRDAGNTAGSTFTKAVADALGDHDSISSAAVQAGNDTATAYRRGLIEKRGDVQDAFQQFVDDMKHPMTVAKELAELNGELTSKALKKGLASGDPLIRQQAEDMRDAIESRIDDLKKLMGDDGSDASASLANHINDSESDAAANARGMVNKINGIFADLKTHYNITVTGDGREGYGYGHGGNRAVGGPVSPNTMYEVTEGGIPEMLAVGNRTYLMMGSKGGQVMPINAPSAGGGVMGGFTFAPVIKVAISARESTSNSGHYQVLQGKPSGGGF